MRLKTNYIFILVVCFAFVLRIYNLNSSSLWWDEIIAINSSRFPADTIFQWTLYNEVHPPLFYFVLKIATYFNNSEFAFRIISVIFGALSVVLLYIAASKAFGKRVGLYSAIVLSVFPYHLLLSRTPRPYALMIDFEIICIIILIEYFKNRKITLLLALSFVNGVMCFIHYLGLFIVGAQGIFLLCLLFW